jgi:hypothetical protein
MRKRGAAQRRVFALQQSFPAIPANEQWQFNRLLCIGAAR